MNGLDFFLLVLLLMAGISGYRHGFALQALSFGGLLLGLAVGAMVAPWVAGLFDSPAWQAGAAIAVLVVFAAAGDWAGWLEGVRLRRRARESRFGRWDAPGGAAFTVIASLLAIWFVALNLVNGPFPSLAVEIRDSTFVRTLDGALPRPPSLLAQVRSFFNRFGYPDVFSGLPPAPADPVKPPTQAEARAATQAAAPSTVRIVGDACGEILEGSGFVAADGYIVTNAHVVAGVRQSHVQTSESGSQPATTVLFDPDLDIAVLRVAQAPGPALELDRQGVTRGAVGATLGYPGGGSLTADRAAVRRHRDALGRDIYGRREVERAIYELQADVRAGDSGGPFVLPDGAVAGVVFAASTTDRGIGYAIVSTEVIPLVDRAVGETRAVSTGPCLR